MSFRLVVSDTVLATVRGSLADADGKQVPFDYTLVCRRATAEELRQMADGDSSRPITDVMLERTIGWRGVLDEGGIAMEFSASGFEAMMNIAGMAGLAFRAYLEACGARGKEKN